MRIVEPATIERPLQLMADGDRCVAQSQPGRGIEISGTICPGPGARGFFYAVKIKWGGMRSMMQRPRKKNSTGADVDQTGAVSASLKMEYRGPDSLIPYARNPRIQLGHLTSEQKRSYLIADNKIAQNDFWNEEFLRLELTELKELGANLELLGFNPMEFIAKRFLIGFYQASS
jgi:hypothetical protein